MPPITRSRLLVGAAFLGLAASTACDRKEAEAGPRLIAPGLAAASALPAAPDASASQAGLPVLHVQTDTLVTTGSTGHTATVIGDPGLRYEWVIRGGTLEGDAHSDTVTWTAGKPGTIDLYCVGTNAAGKQTSYRAGILCEAPPSIEAFAAAPTVITKGSAAKLSWTSKEIKTLTLDPGGKDVSQAGGPGLEVKPEDTTTYKLTATNAAGASVTREVQVKVVPPPAITSFSGVGAIAFGQTLTLSGQFSGGHAEIRKGGEVLASADGGSVQAQAPSLHQGDVFMLVVTNEAGDSVARSLNFDLSQQAAAPQPTPQR